MRATTLSVLLIASLGLSACSGWRDSRVNPSNWFGRDTPVPSTAKDPDAGNPLLPEGSEFAQDVPEPGVLIDEVTSLSVDPSSTGAIIVATGLASREGAFSPRLRPLDRENPVDEDGTLVLQFLVFYPREGTPLGTNATREITAATSVSVQDVDKIRLIRVNGAKGARETRRR
ncbi:MAG: hypothetical protein OIF47_09490 [Marinibacterium sp.]|nr:hypothetical protein [Marinibacterium sp.]